MTDQVENQDLTDMDELLEAAFDEFILEYEMDIELPMRDILFEFFVGGVETMLDDEEEDEEGDRL